MEPITSNIEVIKEFSTQRNQKKDVVLQLVGRKLEMIDRKKIPWWKGFLNYLGFETNVSFSKIFHFVALEIEPDCALQLVDRRLIVDVFSKGKEKYLTRNKKQRESINIAFKALKNSLTLRKEDVQELEKMTRTYGEKEKKLLESTSEKIDQIINPQLKKFETHLNGKIESAKKQLNELHLQIQQKESQLKEPQQRDSKEEPMNERIESAKKQLNELNLQIQQKESQLKELQQRGLKEEPKQNKPPQVSSLKSRFEQQNQSTPTNNHEQEKLKQQLSSLQLQTNQLQTKLTELEKKEKQKNEEIQKLEEDEKKKMSNLIILHSKVGQLQTQSSQLEKSINQKQKELQKLEEEIKLNELKGSVKLDPDQLNSALHDLEEYESDGEEEIKTNPSQKKKRRKKKKKGSSQNQNNKTVENNK